MRKFFLYKKETEKPHFVFVVGKRAWIIPFLDPIEPAKKRLAVEVAPDEAGITRPFCSADGLIESGEIVFNSETGGKLDFTVLKSSGSFMSGDFVFILPSWGRQTKRKLWVIIKPRGKSKGGKR